MGRRQTGRFGNNQIIVVNSVDSKSNFEVYESKSISDLSLGPSQRCNNGINNNVGDSKSQLEFQDTEMNQRNHRYSPVRSNFDRNDFTEDGKSTINLRNKSVISQSDAISQYTGYIEQKSQFNNESAQKLKEFKTR